MSETKSKNKDMQLVIFGGLIAFLILSKVYIDCKKEASIIYFDEGDHILKNLSKLQEPVAFIGVILSQKREEIWNGWIHGRKSQKHPDWSFVLIDRLIGWFVNFSNHAVRYFVSVAIGSIFVLILSVLMRSWEIENLLFYRILFAINGLLGLIYSFVMPADSGFFISAVKWTVPLLILGSFIMTGHSVFADTDLNKGKTPIHMPPIRLPFEQKGLLKRKKEKEGLLVGQYDRNVLPLQSRSWAPHGNQKIFIPFNRVSRGFAIGGGMGAGKSSLMYSIQDQIRETYPNIPILIHDPKGEWLRIFYNPDTDVIFSPNDLRSCAWSLWNDFKKFPQTRKAMISAAVYANQKLEEADSHWTKSSINLLNDLSDAPSIMDTKQSLINWRTKNNVQPFISTYGNSLDALRDLAAVELDAHNSDKKVLSIEDFVHLRGRIFLLNNSAYSEEQRGVLNLFLSAFLNHFIALPDVPEGELCAAAIVDEALRFRLPPDLDEAVYTQNRSKGLCTVIAAQKLPKKSKGETGTWGEQAAYIFAMRMNDLDTQKALNQRVGGMSYDEQKESVSRGATTTTTESTFERKHEAIYSEDFGRLKEREFILIHEGAIAPGIATMVYHKQNQDIPAFIYRDRKDVRDFMKGL